VVLINSLLRIFKGAGRLQLCGGGGGGTDFVGTYGGPSDIKCIFSTIRKQQQGIFRENYPDFLLSILDSVVMS